MNRTLQRKFVFYHGRLLVGEAFDASATPPYEHQDLMYQIEPNPDDWDWNQLVAGWVEGEAPGLEAWFAAVEPDQENVTSAARDGLRVWAERHGAILDFPEEGFHERGRPEH